MDLFISFCHLSLTDRPNWITSFFNYNFNIWLEIRDRRHIGHFVLSYLMHVKQSSRVSIPFTSNLCRKNTVFYSSPPSAAYMRQWTKLPFTKMHLKRSSAKWWAFCPGKVSQNLLHQTQCRHKSKSHLYSSIYYILNFTYVRICIRENFHTRWLWKPLTWGVTYVYTYTRHV